MKTKEHGSTNGLAQAIYELAIAFLALWVVFPLHSPRWQAQILAQTLLPHRLHSLKQQMLTCSSIRLCATSISQPSHRSFLSGQRNSLWSRHWLLTMKLLHLQHSSWLSWWLRRVCSDSEEEHGSWLGHQGHWKLPHRWLQEERVSQQLGQQLGWRGWEGWGGWGGRVGRGWGGKVGRAGEVKTEVCLEVYLEAWLEYLLVSALFSFSLASPSLRLETILSMRLRMDCISLQANIDYTPCQSTTRLSHAPALYLTNYILSLFSLLAQTALLLAAERFAFLGEDLLADFDVLIEGGGVEFAQTGGTLLQLSFDYLVVLFVEQADLWFCCVGWGVASGLFELNLLEGDLPALNSIAQIIFLRIFLLRLEYLNCFLLVLLPFWLAILLRLAGLHFSNLKAHQSEVLLALARVVLGGVVVAGLLPAPQHGAVLQPRGFGLQAGGRDEVLAGLEGVALGRRGVAFAFEEAEGILRAGQVHVQIAIISIIGLQRGNLRLGSLCATAGLR